MSAVLAAVSCCLLPVAASPAALPGLSALNGIWQGVALSIPMVMIQDEIPAGLGISSSLYGAAFGPASMVAGAVTGVTASALGYGNVFWVCAGLSAVAALGMLGRLVLGRRTLPQPVLRDAGVPVMVDAANAEHECVRTTSMSSRIRWGAGAQRARVAPRRSNSVLPRSIQAA